MPISTLDHIELAPQDAVERRFYPRITPRVAVSVEVAEARGQLLDLGENGLSISVQSEVAPNTVSRVSIALNGVAKPIEVTARVVWTAESQKHAGIQFLDLREKDREQIRKWQEQESNQGKYPPVAVPLGAAEGKAENSERIPLPAEPNAADVSLAESMKKPAEGTATSDIPGLASQGLPAENELRVSSGVLVACVVLIAALCFGIGTLFHIPSKKSQNRSDLLTQNKIMTRSREQERSKPIDSDDTIVKPIERGNISDRRQTSSPDQGRDNQIAAGPSGTMQIHKFANVRQKDVPASRSTPDAVLDSRHQTITEEKNSTSEATSGTDAKLSGSNAASQAMSVAGGAKMPTSQATPLSSSSRPTTEPNYSNSAPADSSDAHSQTAITTTPREYANDNVAGRSGVQVQSETASGRSAQENGPTSFPHASSSAMPSPSLPASSENRATRVTVPKGNSSPILRMPGEHVLESPAASIRIQRSVFVPDDHKRWWPLHRSKDKEVLLGELVSHVDPETSRLPLRSGDRVSVRAIVDKDGYVVGVRPVSGAVELMPTVMRAVRKWRYRPTYIDSTRVETEAYVAVEFRPSPGRASR